MFLLLFQNHLHLKTESLNFHKKEAKNEINTLNYIIITLIKLLLFVYTILMVLSLDNDILSCKLLESKEELSEDNCK